MPSTRDPFMPLDSDPITKAQKQRIMKNAAYNEDIKAEWVQWATGDNSKTRLSELNYGQAKQIILAQQGGHAPLDEGWGYFDKNNPKHKLILSLCIQYGWTSQSEKHVEVADLIKLGNWLQYGSAPVHKPLKQLDNVELEKTIKALKRMITWKYSKTKPGK